MLKHASWNNKRHGHSVAWGRLSQDMQTMKQICGLVSSSRYPNYSGSACWLAQSSRPPTSHLPETQNLSAAENPNMWLATTSSTQNMPTTTRRRVSGRAKGYIGLASLSKLTNKKRFFLEQTNYYTDLATKPAKSTRITPNEDSGLFSSFFFYCIPATKIIAVITRLFFESFKVSFSNVPPSSLPSPPCPLSLTTLFFSLPLSSSTSRL